MTLFLFSVRFSGGSSSCWVDPQVALLETLEILGVFWGNGQPVGGFNPVEKYACQIGSFPQGSE